MTFSIKYTKHDTQYDGSAVILSVIMLRVANKPFMLSVIMLNVIMLNVIMLNVLIMIVVAVYVACL
jgi:hypothetical protein